MLLRNCVWSTVSKRFMTNAPKTVLCTLSFVLWFIAAFDGPEIKGPSTKYKAQRCLSFQKIGPIPLRLLFSSFAAPLGNLSMMTGQQNFRHAHSLKLRWSRVMRIIEQTI